MKTDTLSFETANGATTAYVALPGEVDEATKAVVLIHEWWGLNEYMKTVVERYAVEGFVAIAPDLYRGKVASNPDEAAEMMAALEIPDGLDTISNAMKAATEKFGFESFGISGYCMGGTYALRAACEVDGLKASAPYYGDVPPDEILAKLSIPVVFVSGVRDAWITPEKVAELTTAATKHDLDVESLEYEADHAFANESRLEVYDETAAEDAWAKVMSFFRKHL